MAETNMGDNVNMEEISETKLFKMTIKINGKEVTISSHEENILQDFKKKYEIMPKNGDKQNEVTPVTEATNKTNGAPNGTPTGAANVKTGQQCNNWSTTTNREEEENVEKINHKKKVNLVKVIKNVKLVNLVKINK